MGIEALPTDKFTRTLGVYKAAQRDMNGINPVYLSAINAYCDEINSYLE